MRDGMSARDLFASIIKPPVYRFAFGAPSCFERNSESAFVICTAPNFRRTTGLLTTARGLHGNACAVKTQWKFTIHNDHVETHLMQAICGECVLQPFPTACFLSVNGPLPNHDTGRIRGRVVAENE